MQVRRYDKAELRSPERTPQGFLRADAHLTRAGVFPYRMPDGTVRRELRLPEEVFHPEALASFSLAPLTLDHPPESVTSANARKYQVGTVGESIEPDGTLVKATVVVQDEEAIAAVESGKKRELSCGYSCDVELSSGEWEGQSYDAIQRNIRGNHVALVPKGRAGPAARLHLDAADAEQVEETPNAEPPAEKHMEKITINGVEYEVPTQAAQAIKVLVAKHEEDEAELEKKAEELEKEKSEAEAKADTLQARLAEAEKARNDAADPARIREAVRARVALERQAATVLGSTTKLDEMDDLAVKKAVIMKATPSISLENKSDAYIEAAYDLAVEGFAKKNSPVSKLREATTTKADGSEIKNDRESRYARYAEMASKPLAASAK